MRVLVTGGSGFIATNFFQFLSQTPAEVTLFDRKYGQDLRDPAAVKAAILGKNYDVVYHLGALTNIDQSIKEPWPFWDSNVNGTFNVLEAAREENAQRAGGKNPMTVVYMSSSEVYGTSQWEPRPMSEEHPLAPHSPYAASKVAAERLCYSYWQTYGLPVKMLRPFNQYGPYQTEEKLIPKLIRRALDGKSMPVYADGLARRDWVFVRDTCEALWLATKLPDGTAVNIATGVNYTVLDVCTLVKRILQNERSAVVHVDHVDDRWGHVKCLRGDGSLCQELLGWRPPTSFEEGLKKTVAFYLAQWDIEHPVREAAEREPLLAR